MISRRAASTWQLMDRDVAGVHSGCSSRYGSDRRRGRSTAFGGLPRHRTRTRVHRVVAWRSSDRQARGEVILGEVLSLECVLFGSRGRYHGRLGQPGRVAEAVTAWGSWQLGHCKSLEKGPSRSMKLGVHGELSCISKARIPWYATLPPLPTS